MRTREEIKNTTGVKIKKEGKDGFGGSVYPVEYKKGKAVIKKDFNSVLHFIFSTGCGFEHLSVSTPVRCPTWDEMCKMKDIFWRDDEVCIQLHPKKEDYVDNMKYCLHIWKPIDKEIPTPPSVMVGFRKGKEEEDFQKVLELYDEMGKWED